MLAQPAMPSLQMLVPQFPIWQMLGITANAANCLANWQLVMECNINHSTWWGAETACNGVCVPGQVYINNQTSYFLYLKTSTCMPTLHSHQAHTITSSTNHDPHTCLNKYIKKHQYWWKWHHTTQLIKMALLYSGAKSTSTNPVMSYPSLAIL